MQTKNLLNQILAAAEQRVFAATARLGALNASELADLAADMRAAILAATSASGGHVSPNLGVVELSIALWRVFDPYADRLFWDVSHQIYAHKLLSGRSLAHLRTFGGPSGYAEPAESAADVLCAGHSSTSISLAVGTAKALELANSPQRAVAIIGDGAMGSGLAYEALNELGALRLPAVVVLNDNKMSISAPIGALSRFLSQSIASSAYQRFRRGVLKALEHLPDSARYAAKRAEDSLKLASPAGMFFEELGLSYIGPIDGHDIAACERALHLAQELGKPALVHVITQKGRGYAPAQNDALGAWHGVGPFALEPDYLQAYINRYACGGDGATAAEVGEAAAGGAGAGEAAADAAGGRATSTTQFEATEQSATAESSETADKSGLSVGAGSAPTAGETAAYSAATAGETAAHSAATAAYSAPAITATAAFSEALSALMAADERVVAITAAMPSGTGLERILREHPRRCWDVGIAEAHACTQAAALAAAGLRPVVAIYSTFAQRAIDSIIHDIALNAVPAVLALDRAGVVGQDGKTHQGVFDLALLRCVPNLSLFAPVGRRSMAALLTHCARLAGPSALRYARGSFALPEEFDRPDAAPYFLRKRGAKVLALGWGEGVADALAVGDAHGFDVANLVCAKPICEEFLAELRGYSQVLVYSHTARAGGLGELLAAAGVKAASWEFEDAFITHGHTEAVLRSLGRDQASLVAAAAEFADGAAGAGGAGR